MNVYRPQLDFRDAPTLCRYLQNWTDFVQIVTGPVGCTDADTEFLTPRGWKRIADYEAGDLVAQWQPDGSMEYVEPSDYINAPCDEMWLFENAHGISMMLSDSHRLPLYDWSGSFTVKTAAQVARRPSRHEVPVHFLANRGIGAKPIDIKLRVMIAADAHYPARGNQCVIAVRKHRKIIRVRELLNEAGIEFQETIYANRETEHIFSFARPDFRKPMHLSADWYRASSEELQILLDECLLWDGLANHEENRFYTTKPDEADIVQFAAHACGRVARIHRHHHGEPHHADTYTVQWANEGSAKNSVGFRGDNISITRAAPPDGRQYCFTVPSSFWLARRRGRIFVTGNSGKSFASATKLMMIANRQDVDPRTQTRRSRMAIVRNTAPELKSTTIKTWLELWPEAACGEITYSSPITHRIYAAPRGGQPGLDAEFHFLPMDHPKDVRKLLSTDYTAIWLNEVSEIAQTVLGMARKRVGRFPPRDDTIGVMARHPMIICDTNAPDEDHWLVDLEREKPAGFAFYRQPPAVLEVQRVA